MSKNIADASNRFIDQVAHSSDAAMEGVSHSLQTARKQVAAGSRQASDWSMAYIRDEPVKSVLIAAATGAALVALARLIGRP